MNDNYESDEDEFDLERDQEFYTPGNRFLTRDDLLELREALLGTDDGIEIGLSTIGIDPDEFDEGDFDFIEERLDDLGLEFCEDEDQWVET